VKDLFKKVVMVTLRGSSKDINSRLQQASIRSNFRAYDVMDYSLRSWDRFACVRLQ